MRASALIWLKQRQKPTRGLNFGRSAFRHDCIDCIGHECPPTGRSAFRHDYIRDEGNREN